jgi:hypothetical protein
MVDPQRKSKEWIMETGSPEARIRCSYQRVGKLLERFTVQLEIVRDAEWVAVTRFDNAHDFCHRDTLHPDGTQDKTPIHVGDVNQTFTFAIEELRTNWKAHRDRYLGEIKP